MNTIRTRIGASRQLGWRCYLVANSAAFTVCGCSSQVPRPLAGFRQPGEFEPQGVVWMCPDHEEAEYGPIYARMISVLQMLPPGLANMGCEEPPWLSRNRSIPGSRSVQQRALLDERLPVDRHGAPWHEPAEPIRARLTPKTRTQITIDADLLHKKLGIAPRAIG